MKKERGFIGIIVLILIALIVLKYLYDFSVFEAAASPQGQGTITYTHQILNTIWSYIQVPVTFAWEKVVWPLIGVIWANFQSFLDWGQQTASTGAR